MKTRISRLYIIHIALLIEQIFNIRLNQQTPIKYDSPTSNSTGLYTGGISESVEDSGYSSIFKDNITYSKNSTSSSIKKPIQKLLNDSFLPSPQEDIEKNFKFWKYRLLPAESKDLVQYMLFKTEGHVTPQSLNAFYNHFVIQFSACDYDANQIIDSKELFKCFKNDTYMKNLIPPPEAYGYYIPNISNQTEYFSSIIRVFDKSNKFGLNFVDFLNLRLFIFSWRFCSNYSFTINELNFECALEITGQSSTFSRTFHRNLYSFWISQSANSEVRQLDFISFSNIADSARLFGKINNKMDKDITLKEFNMALDAGVLPRRYNQEIINYFYKLTSNINKPNSYIDMQTFIFYDYYLRVFNKYCKSLPYNMNITEFYLLMESKFLPTKLKSQIYLIPIYKMDKNSNNKLQTGDVKIFNGESDFFLYKFSQVEAKNSNKVKNNQAVNSKTKKKEANDYGFYTFGNMYQEPFNYNITFNMLFDACDPYSSGRITFYEFASIIQFTYIFSKVDVNLKGRVTADILEDYTINYSEFPSISNKILHRGVRLSEYENSVYFDLFSYIALMKVDDIASMLFRSDQNLVNEIELRSLISKINMANIPNPQLNKCLRSFSEQKLPLYDWECTFKLGTRLNINYYDIMYNNSYKKINKFKTENTADYEVSSIYQ